MDTSASAICNPSSAAKAARPMFTEAASRTPAARSLRAEAPREDGVARTEPGSPFEEYKIVCEFLRLYATLRFYRLALLLGTTGSIVTALTSLAVRSHFARLEILKVGGLVVSLAFLVMEFRATSRWQELRVRAIELARALRFQPMTDVSRWNPLATSGAGFYLHALIVALWATSLLLNVHPGP